MRTSGSVLVRAIVSAALIGGLVTLPAGAQQNPEDRQTAAILFSARERMSQQNEAWFHDGEYLAVIQNQTILVTLDPHDEETFSNLQWMYGNVEKYDWEWSIGKLFAIQNPTYSDAPYYEAQFLFLHHAYAKIPALLEPTLSRQPPPDANIFRFLAHSYDRLGYVEDCVRVWDAMLKLHPNDGPAKANRAKAAAKLKRDH